jgi:Tol biopolymer transport system component
MRLKPSNAVLVAVAAVASVGTVHRAEGQGPGLPGGLTFYSARAGNNEIYTADLDAGRPLRLTEAAASDIDPDMSRNGRDVIFTSNRTGNNEIFLVGSAGGPAVNLSNHAANDGWARWAPDGWHIVFHSNRDGNFELYVMAADGSGLTRLTNYAGIDQFPDWSPNGQEIAFRRDNDIYVLDLRSGETRRLTAAPPLNQMPAWSPDGKELVFMSARDGYPSVFVMNADGSGQRNLTPKDAGDIAADWVSRAPSWSRNGRQIYFMSSRPSTGLDTELFVINADGTGTTRLTSTIGVDGSPRVR